MEVLYCKIHISECPLQLSGHVSVFLRSVIQHTDAVFMATQRTMTLRVPVNSQKFDKCIRQARLVGLFPCIYVHSSRSNAWKWHTLKIQLMELVSDKAN